MMRLTKTKALAMAGLLAVAVTSSAMADTPGKDWMTKEQVTAKLQQMGFTSVKKLEADDGHWEGDAMKDGKWYEIHVDPHSGALTKNQPKN